MLPNDYLKPCIAMMGELLERYCSSIVLCTATQPALDAFFKKDMHITELCPHMEEQFEFFRRASFKINGEITEETLIQQLMQEEQALCIVNTKKRAQSIYQKLKGEGVYHLSTSMYPIHRRRTLDMIRERLDSGKRCILISTSLVEAGVDLDFQTVYRQLAGVDSMIQAAGRCNREGKRKAEESKVYIFQFSEKEYIPGQRMQMDVAKDLLTDGNELSDLETVEKYFDRLYYFRGQSLDKKKIMEEFQNKQSNFAKVAKEFKLIEENTKTIFVNQEQNAEDILQELKYQGFTKVGMRKAGQYCINVYETEFDKLYSAGMVRQVAENIQDFYELVGKNQYTEELGLRLDVDYGMACFM